MKPIKICHGRLILNFVNFIPNGMRDYTLLERRARKNQNKINGLLDPIVGIHRKKIFRFLAKLKQY